MKMRAISDPDLIWFDLRPQRLSRIRPARPGEAKDDFETLGDHNPARRLMLILRIPESGALIWIPFLSSSDDTIEDTDEVLMPIIREIMEGARGALN